MKNCYLLFIISIFIICSCTRDNSCKVISDYIIAGNTSTDSVYSIDFEPDFVAGIDWHSHTGSGGTVSVDFNADGIDDYGFYSGYYQAVIDNQFLNSIQPMNGNEIAIFSNDRKTAFPFNKDDLINNELVWCDSTSIRITELYYEHTGIRDIVDTTWNNLSNKYIAFRMYDDEKTYYGWIQLDVVNYSFYIDSYGITACK